MGKTLRTFGGIGAGLLLGVLGPGFSATRFALGNFVFSTLVPPKQPAQEGGTLHENAENSAAVGTAIWEIYGECERTGGDLIRCAKDAQGRRSGIEEVERTESVGGGGSGGGALGGQPKQTVKTTVSYLNATFAFFGGFTRFDRVIEVNGRDGEKVIYDESAQLDEEIVAELEALQVLIDEAPDDFSRGLRQARYDALVANQAETRGLAFVPIIGTVSGDVIGLMNENVRMYFGSEEQPVDSVEQTWYEDGVSADRGISKIVFNRYGPLEAGTTFRVRGRNANNERREIIIRRLKRAGIPESRIDLRSIGESQVDTGWFVNQIEPARNLAEAVAAKSFHDLHFLPTARGAAFTDISRVNPTYIALEESEFSSYENNDGNGQMPSSSEITIEGMENRPRSLEVEYVDKSLNYRNNSAITLWPGATGDPQRISLNLVGGLQEVQDFTDISMAEIQVAAGSERLSLMPARAEVACGCVLVKPNPSDREPNGVRLLRVMNQGVASDGSLDCTCVPYDPAAEGRHREVVQPSEPAPGVAMYGTLQIIFIDNVSLTDYMSGQATLLAAGTSPISTVYPGMVVSTPSRAFDDFDLPLRATVGISATDYVWTDADLFAFDYVTTLRVYLQSGVLASASEDAVNDKANLLYWGGTYLSFTTATPLGDGEYEITGLMPGRKGSDFIQDIPAGATVVKITDENGNLDHALKTVAVALGKLNVPITYEGTGIRNTAKTTGEMNLTVQGVTLKALSVSPEIRKEDDGAGGYTLRAFARSRFAEAEEATWASGVPMRWADPLSFTIRLLDGAEVKDIRVVTPSAGEIEWTYEEADLIAWFGAVPLTVSGDIVQNGTYGPGFTREFTV